MCQIVIMTQFLLDYSILQKADKLNKDGYGQATFNPSTQSWDVIKRFKLITPEQYQVCGTVPMVCHFRTASNCYTKSLDMAHPVSGNLEMGRRPRDKISSLNYYAVTRPLLFHNGNFCLQSLQKWYKEVFGFKAAHGTSDTYLASELYRYAVMNGASHIGKGLFSTADDFMRDMCNKSGSRALVLHYDKMKLFGDWYYYPSHEIFLSSRSGIQMRDFANKVTHEEYLHFEGQDALDFTV